MKIKRIVIFSVALLLFLLLAPGTATQPAHAATLTVTNLNNSGAGSLRQAIVDAAPGDTITFSTTGTIVLTAGELVIDKDLTIDGGGTITINGNNAVRVFTIATGNVAFNNLIIINGSAGSGSGGGIYNYGGTVTVRDSTLSGNEAYDGGGIYNDGSAVTVGNSIISDNGAEHGGGIYNNGGTVTVNDSTVSRNEAYDNGGGIHNNGTVTVSNSILFGNNAYTDGGGIFNNYGATVTVSNSTLSGNEASLGGGGGIINGGTVTVSNSTFSGNGAGNSGGGIHNDGTVTVSNSTFSGNFAIYGGGIFNSVSGTFSIGHSILANTMAPLGSDCYGVLTSQDYNLIEGTVDCIINGTTTHNITGQDPILDPLADNGGPTLTHLPASNSPVLDKIPNTACTASPTNGIDQRGAARNYDNTGSSVNDCDMGAVERRETLTVGSCSGADLSGSQAFNFTASGNQVTVNVTTANGLKCITIEEMGPGVNHLLATGSVGNPGIKTNNWWHINGNINSGFAVDITLPYASANADSRVCKWRGDLGGAGWDCGYTSNTAASVTHTNLTSFSDWAVGNNVGPTAVSLQFFSATTTPHLVVFIGTSSVVLLLLLGSWFLWRKQNA